MKNIDDIAIVIQARLNSQRLPQKMLKPFSDSNLFDLLLNKLDKSEKINNSKVYLSIYENELKQAASKYNFNIFNRSKKSANEDNDIRIIYEWYKHLEEKYVVLISACNPLLKIETIENFIHEFSKSQEAGMFAVFEKKTYYWNKEGQPITNWGDSKIMNTKIVEPVYEAAHCLYASEISFLKKECWMSDQSPPKPELFVMNELEAFDIDFQWQFDVAQKLLEVNYE